MLDNGDGAVRSGKAGFPGANIPANCSGTVTFERKESQTTLPVKSYQLVIDSCSVIDQQSGEMEMHLALIVDGYKFAQTGYYFRYLPNSIAQLALPEWELVSQPASPVRLDVDGYWLAGYEFEGDERVYAYGRGADKSFIGVGDDGIWVRVSEVSQGQYSCVLDDLAKIPADEVTENPYDEDDVVLEVDVTGTDPETSQLICNIRLISDSGDVDFQATGVRCAEDDASLITLDSFVAI